ncbi:hypothetical protein M5D96_011385 [Drosophila gunungcola]|uniref:Aminopeptidase n=1 Tax=Drosophila gunungcola TaxID=103775 RepID=A0A9P9YFF4_9MUSC|nr:hypothetical protein M5D96_011385 [Drosophila gunungcola]
MSQLNELCWIFLLLMIPSTPAMYDHYRLPTALEPLHYNLRILTHLESTDQWFEGSVNIDLLARESTKNITLHAAYLKIDENRTTVRSDKDNNCFTDIEVNEVYNFYILHLCQELEKGQLYQLELHFSAKLNDSLSGYYKSSYTDESRKEVHRLAITQFSPTFARQAFPCFDEPSFKSTFNVTLGHHKNYTGLTGMPVLGCEEQFSAMENWGLVVFNEERLPENQGVDLQQQKDKYAETVAHEYAHQWFGNLVTMKWWNDLWLKEGTSTYFAYLALDILQPDLTRGERFIAKDLGTFFGKDSSDTVPAISKDVKDPSQILGQFTEYVYEKGALTVRMLHKLIGKESFFRGIRSFLSKYSLGNVAQGDLWDSLEEAAHLDFNLSRAMDSWTLQGGYPLVTLIRDYKTGGLTLNQTRFYQGQNISKNSPCCLLECLKKEEDLLPWQRGVGILNGLGALLHGQEAKEFKIYMKRLLLPLYNSFPKLAGIALSKPALKDIPFLQFVYSQSCRHHVDDCINQAKLLNTFHRNGSQVELPIDFQKIAYCSFLEEGGEKEFLTIFGLFQNSTNAAQRRIWASALGCTRDFKLFEHHAKTLGEIFKKKELTGLLVSLAENLQSREELEQLSVHLKDLKEYEEPLRKALDLGQINQKWLKDCSSDFSEALRKRI